MWIALSGAAGAGKDTIAQHLVLEHGYTRVAFADPVREMLLALNPVTGWIGNDTPVFLSDVVITVGWDEAKRNSIVRGLLQRLGTDVMRCMVDDNFWVKRGEKTARAAGDRVVFSDVRFPNEADMIKRYGGIRWQIERPGHVNPAAGHVSEHALDDLPDVMVTNNGSLAMLARQVDRALTVITKSRT